MRSLLVTFEPNSLFALICFFFFFFFLLLLLLLFVCFKLLVWRWGWWHPRLSSRFSYLKGYLFWMNKCLIKTRRLYWFSFCLLKTNRFRKPSLPICSAQFPTDSCNQHLVDSRAIDTQLRCVTFLKILRFLSQDSSPIPSTETLPETYFTSPHSLPFLGRKFPVTSWPSDICNSRWVTDLWEHIFAISFWDLLLLGPSEFHSETLSYFLHRVLYLHSFLHIFDCQQTLHLMLAFMHSLCLVTTIIM